MKIVFLGTPDFAVASLDILVKNGYEVVGVVTVPDKPAGRGMKLQESAVKKYAVANGLKVLQPEKLKDEAFLKELSELKADLQVIVAFRMLPKVVWNMPKYGTFNLHGSLLPDYRGAAPINWAIINGEKESGVTTFFIDDQIDTGAIIDNRKVAIEPSTNAGELHDQLMMIGAELVLETVKKIESGNIKTIVQDDILNGRAPKMAYKIFRETCKINWSMPKEEIYNLIRGLSPYPAAYTDLSTSKGELSAKIFEVKMSDKSLNQGEIQVSNGQMFIGTSNGSLEIIEFQLAGKKRMKVEDFLKGNSMENWKAL